ncbi:P-loop containing nucleoside triphosphate hydrolase protein [Mycena olivaceomarginata]|nr:P-loop containing nucleoside triphosphate hydrolase protein [Mycena olivaceomarginata]
MLSRDDSQPLYITGGQGGNGGHGHPHGTGGPGGAGLGPNVNIHVQQLIAHNLHAGLASQQAFQPSNIQAYQIINHCPPPSRIFQGRRDILDKMHYFFASDVGIQHIYVLYGLGGAGKTQITLKFINESSSRFSDTFFIDASTIATIDTGLKNIAVLKGSGDSLQDGLLWLASRVEQWLLVFDNTDDPSINLNDFIPQCNHGNIIITSRNPGIRVYGSHSPVSDMEEEDAVALLLKSAAQAVTAGTMLTATEIVKALHYLPLAIVQAGSFISKSQDLDGYLTLYTKNQARLLGEMPAQTHDRYVWTVYTTWQMSFDQLTQPAAMLLQYCSFLHYNGISEQIFSYASKYTFPSNGPSKEDLQEPLEFLALFLGPSGEWNSLKFSNMTNEVQAYSLIGIDAEKRLFSIHPLVHAWSQTTGNPEKYLSNMGSILGMALSACQPYDIQLGSLAICPHVELALQLDAEVALVFKEQYGLILWEAGKYKQYEKLVEGVLEKQKQVLGDNHPQTRAIWPAHTQPWESIKRPKNSMLLCWRNRNRFPGDNHPDTLLTMGNLASTYSALGEHQKAKELKATVLEKRNQFPLPTYSPSLHVSPPPPPPLQPSHAPSSLLPPHRLGKWLKKQTASAAAEPALAGETKATKKHALQDNTHSH